MSFHFMPWYHGDHLRDAQRLTHELNWVYFLLINEYWATGGLPDDDEQLAAIAGLSRAKWRKAKPILQSFFNDGWCHKRIDKELEKALKKSKGNSAKARDAANKRWAALRERQAQQNATSTAPSNAPSISQAMPEQCSSDAPLGVGVDVKLTSSESFGDSDSIPSSGNLKTQDSLNGSPLRLVRTNGRAA